jgi:hypothetical protein
MRNFFAHYPLSSLFLDLSIDEAEDAVVHIDRAAPHQGNSLFFLEGQFKVEVLG